MRLVREDRDQVTAQFQLVECFADAVIEAVGGFHIIVFVMRPEIKAEIVGDPVKVRDGRVSAVLGRAESLLLNERADVLLGLGNAAFGQSVGEDEVQKRLCVGKSAVKVEYE